MEKDFITCPICNTIVRAYPCQKRTFCSKNCQNISRRRPIEECFWEKVNKNGPIPEHCHELGPCWLWTGASDGRYGHIKFKGKQCPATEVSWRIHYGDFDRSLMICHKCDRPICIRPTHLFLGTGKENLLDASMKGRIARGTRNSQSRFTEEQIIEIRRLYSEGVGWRQQFGVTQPAIAAIVGRRTWAHVK